METIIGVETNKSLILVSQKVRATCRRGKKGERKRKKRKKKEKENNDQTKVWIFGFLFEIMCFWISRLFGMDYWTFIWISMVLGFLI